MMSGSLGCILIFFLRLAALIGPNSSMTDNSANKVFDLPETCVSQYRTLKSILNEYFQDSSLDYTSWSLLENFFQKQSYSQQIYHVVCTLKDAFYNMQVMNTTVVQKARIFVLVIKCKSNAKVNFSTDLNMEYLTVKPIYFRIVDCIIFDPSGLQLPMLNFMRDIKLTPMKSYSLEMMDFNEIAIGSISGKWNAIGHWYIFNLSTEYYLNPQYNVAPYILLSNCNIRSLPISLLTLPVIILHLSNNDIRNIDTLFEPNSYLLNNSHVLSINLASNEISNLKVFSQSGLTQINLSHNRITHLNRETFRNLKSLNDLDISCNRINYIEPGTFQHSPLQRVNISQNYLHHFSYSQAPHMPCTLDLSFNKFPKPPFHDSNYSTPFLMNVDIRGNPFQCDCSITRFGKFILDHKMDNYFNQIENVTNIDSISGAPFTNLKHVVCVEPFSLKDTPLIEVSFNITCPVFHLCPEYCICDLDLASNVTTINCMEKNLQNLPVYAPEGTLKLLLTGNSIHSIPHQPFLQRVIIFNVSRNNISSIPVSVFMYAEEIDLSHNNLETLPTDLMQTNTSKIRRLDLSNNPWRCTYENAWLISWLSTHARILQHDIWCANGVLKGKSILSLSTEVLPGQRESYMTLVVIIGIILLLGFILLVMLCLRPFDVKVLFWIITEYRRHIDEASSTNIDAYVYYTIEESTWIREQIIHQLKQMKPPYQLLDFQNDCSGGTMDYKVLNQIIPQCKRAIFILSDKFCDNDKDLYHFHKIRDCAYSSGHPTMIFIARKGFNFNLLPDYIQLHITSDNLIQFEDILFWPKLKYLLPEKY